MTFPTWVQGQENPEVPVNEAFDILAFASVYGRDPDTTTGLTWGYLGGRWAGFAVTAGTLTLTDSATNYIVVALSTGVISVSTSDTNWNDDAAYARVYQLTTSGGLVTAIEDYRAGSGGVFGSGGGGGGGSTIGKQQIFIPASAMVPSSSSGCEPLSTVATASGQPDITGLRFDPSTQEYAEFSVAMPKRWDAGTVTATFTWTHPATTTNFGVAWGLQGVACGDGDAIGASFGTAQVATDTGGTTNTLFRTAETSAITIAGTPAKEDTVFFRVYRDPANGSDTMAVDAILLGVRLFYTSDAENDA